MSDSKVEKAPPVSPSPEVEAAEEEDVPYKELQARAKEVGVPANLPTAELSAEVTAAEQRTALEAEYGPFIANLWQDKYPNFACPVEGCQFLVLGNDRAHGEEQIAAHYNASHIPAGPEATSALLGPDGKPLF